jgi:hypothetical protein
MIFACDRALSAAVSVAENRDGFHVQLPIR